MWSILEPMREKIIVLGFMDKMKQLYLNKANEGKDVQFVTDIHANARGCEEAVKSIIRAKQRKMRTA